MFTEKNDDNDSLRTGTCRTMSLLTREQTVITFSWILGPVPESFNDPQQLDGAHSPALCTEDIMVPPAAGSQTLLHRSPTRFDPLRCACKHVSGDVRAAQAR